MLGHEVAVEQPQDGLLGDPLGEVEVVLLERLAFRQAGAVNPPLQGPLPADGDFFADQGGQHVQHGTPLAGRLVEHLLVQFGDAVEFQLRQIARAVFRGVAMSCVGFLVGLASESPHSRS